MLQVIKGQALCGKRVEVKRPAKRTDSPPTQWPLEAGSCHTLLAGPRMIGSKPIRPLFTSGLVICTEQGLYPDIRHSTWEEVLP